MDQDVDPTEKDTGEESTAPTGDTPGKIDPGQITVTSPPTNGDSTQPCVDDVVDGESSPNDSALGHNSHSLLTDDDTDKLPTPTPADADQPHSQGDESEAGCSDGEPVVLQLQLLEQEADADTDLDQEAAHGLRRSSQQEGGGRHEVVMEMDTFQRSSLRRDSFVLAVRSGEDDSGGTDSKADGASSLAKDHSTEHVGSDKSYPSMEELEIFLEEEDDYWQKIRERLQGRGKWVVCGTALLLLFVVFTVILIPQSLVYVEYHQMALARSRLTGRVERGRTLYSGCYLFLPDTDLVLFQATAHHVQSRMEVLSSEGLALHLQLSLQYFLKGEELGQLHEAYGQQYDGVVRTVIESEVKNSVVNLTLDQYRLHRATVERLIYKHLAVRLQGDCCPHHCLNTSSWSAANCNSSCNASPNCTRGLHLTLQPQHVQLGAIDIPQEINERYLRFTLLQVEAEKEKFLQYSTVESKKSELLTKDIKNQAHEVVEAARWDSRRIQLESEASAELRRQRAYSQALKQLLAGLNITAADHRLSLLLLLAYRQVEQPLFFGLEEGLSLWGGLGHA